MRRKDNKEKMESQVKANKCIYCKEDVGNNVFTCCDNCWDKFPMTDQGIEESKISDYYHKEASRFIHLLIK